MKIKLASLANDIGKERDGEWIEPKEWPGLNPEKPNEMVPVPGLAFLVRSTNYPDYVTARQDALEAMRKDYPNDRVPADETARIEGRLAVEHLLLDWRGLDVDFSPEVVTTVLAAEEHRILRNMIYWCAGRVGKRQVEFIADTAKN